MPTSNNRSSKASAAWMLIFILATAMIAISTTQDIDDYGTDPDPGFDDATDDEPGITDGEAGEPGPAAGAAPPDSGTGDPGQDNEPGTAEEENDPADGPDADAGTNEGPNEPGPAGDAPPDSVTGDPELENEPGTADEENNQAGVEGGDAGPAEEDGSMGEGEDAVPPGEDGIKEGGDTGPAEEDGREEGGDGQDTVEGGDEPLAEEEQDRDGDIVPPPEDNPEEDGDEPPAEEGEGGNGDARPPEDTEDGGDEPPAEEEEDGNGDARPATEEGAEEDGDRPPAEEEEDVNGDTRPPAEDGTEDGGDSPPAEEEEDVNGDTRPPAEDGTKEGGDEPPAEEGEDGDGDTRPPEDTEDGGDEPPAEEEEDGNGDTRPATEEGAEEDGDRPPAEEEEDVNGDTRPPAEDDTEDGGDRPPADEEEDVNEDVRPPAEDGTKEGGDEPPAEEEEDGDGDTRPPAEDDTEDGGDRPPAEEEEDGDEDARPPAEDDTEDGGDRPPAEEEEDGDEDARPPAEDDTEDGGDRPPAEEEEDGDEDARPPAEDDTEDGGDRPPAEEDEDGDGDERPPAPDAEEDEDEYEYEFPEEVEGDFEPDSSFEERLVSVHLGTRVQTQEEEQRRKAEAESNDECMIFQNEEEEEEGLTTYADQGLVYAPDYEANPVVVVLSMFLASLASGSSRRLQAASSGENIKAMEVSEHFKTAALEITGIVSAQLLDDGFTADNVNVTVMDGSQGNVSLNIRFPVGAPAAVAQIVVDSMQDPDVGLEHMSVTENTDGDPVYMSDLYGGIEYVSTDAFEIPPDPQLTEIYLRVVTQRDLEPWWYLDANGERQGIVKDLIQMVNASDSRPSYLKLQVVSDDKLPNNTRGLVDMLSNGNADIAIGPVMLSADDMTVTSLSSPLLTTGNILIIPKPRVAAASIKFKNIFTFLAPFTTELWIAIVACVLLAGFILWLLERDADHSDDHDFLPEDGDAHNILKSLWLSMGTYNAALVTHNPLTTLGRLFSISYALLVFVIINSYTANLASYLVTEGAVVYTVDSLEAANQDSSIGICVFAESTTSMMAKQQYPKIKYVYIDNSSLNNTLAMQEAKQKLYSGECSGFVVEEHIGNFYLNLDDSSGSAEEDTHAWCDLMQKGDRLVLPGSYGVPVNNNLPRPIQEVLEEIVESLRDSRALPRLIQTYLAAGARCPVESNSNVPQLSVVDLFGVIVIFFTAAIVSTIQLVWTFFIKKRFMKGEAACKTPSSSHSPAPEKGSLLTGTAPVGESVNGCMSLKANDDNETHSYTEAPAGPEVAVRIPQEQPHQSTAEILPNVALQQQGSSGIASSKSFFPERPPFA